MNTKVALITVATGKYYNKFIPNLFDSISKFTKFDHDFICFTDNLEKCNFKKIKVEHLSWPKSSLFRYKNILDNEQIFSKYSHILYLDADMLVVDDLYDDILSELIGVIHPGFEKCLNNKKFPYERNSLSTAYIEYGFGKRYYQGCIQGGLKDRFIKMVKDIIPNIEQDLEKNYIAEWFDESHLNKYYLNNPPTLDLSSNYAWPSEYINKSYYGVSHDKAKILHLEKNTDLRN
jgi:histo-blood group ABO system transferase